MQRIFGDRPIGGARPGYDWDALSRQAHMFERLHYPHRWKDGSPELGQWILRAREALASGERIDLRNDVPPSVSVVFGDNQAEQRLDLRLSTDDRRPVDTFVRSQPSLLILTHYNDTPRRHCAASSTAASHCGKDPRAHLPSPCRVLRRALHSAQRYDATPGRTPGLVAGARNGVFTAYVRSSGSARWRRGPPPGRRGWTSTTSSATWSRSCAPSWTVTRWR